MGMQRTKSGVCMTGGVGAIDLQELGRRVDAGEFEDVAEARPAPFGVAHRAASPLDAGQFRSEEGASVAGAFQGCRDGVLRQLLQVGEASPAAVWKPGP